MTGGDYNERVVRAMRNFPLGGTRQESGRGGEHHWKVEVARGHDEEFRTWTATVGAGTVNGRVAEIKGRSLLDKERPELEIKTPSRDLKKMGHFIKVPPAQRPKHFRTRAMWEKELYRGTVTVSGGRPPAADVLAEIPFILPTFTLVGLLSEIAIRAALAELGILELMRALPLLPPYRVNSVATPLLLTGSEQFRLAHLWLLRDPAQGPWADELIPDQEAYWSFAAWQIVEDQGLLSLLPQIQALSDIGNLAAQEIFKLLLDSARVHWWTV